MLVAKLREEEETIMFQDDLINKIMKVFVEKVQNMQEYGMSARSGEHIKRPDEGDPTLDKDEQTMYRSEVGLLLNLVKFSRPNISNTVRDLSKVMDKATSGNIKNMLRTIKYVLDTRN